MKDPQEGIAADGTIRTGVSRSHVSPEFEPLIQQVVEARSEGSLYLYGSVATGQAQRGISDLDLLTVGAVRPNTPKSRRKGWFGVSRSVRQQWTISSGRATRLTEIGFS